MTEITRKFTTDILVIGAGASGARAALAAAEKGSKVVLTNKGPMGRSGITLTAAGGMQAPFHPDDSPEQYFHDTVRCGYYLSDSNLARVLAEEACARITDLERYGINFVRDEQGRYALKQFPGQSQPRNLFVKGGGFGLVAGLRKACLNNPAVTVMDDFFVTGLVKGDAGREDVVAGALGIDLRTGELVFIQAAATIMATGGCQRLWEVNDCPTDAAGDGIAMAYRAGAELVDMEMVLFYPSVIIWPPSLRGAFAHYEFLDPLILDGKILDRNGESVLPNPLPVRDEAMRLMAAAIESGRGTVNGGLYWYVGNSPKGEERARKTLDIAQYNYMRFHGVEPAQDKIEVAPGAHYLIGGISIDAECRTTVRGLFAAPECAGNFDGANRLAGSALTATQVFGARSGWAAHALAAAGAAVEPDRASLEKEVARVRGKLTSCHIEASSAAEVVSARDKLCRAAQQQVGIRRNADGLKAFLSLAEGISTEIGKLRAIDCGVFNQQLMDLLQLDFLCEAAGLVAGSALTRQESRGHHFRTDFPQRDDANWLKHTTVRLGNIGCEFATRPVVRP